MTEGDNLIKSPLYNGYQASVMAMFNSSRQTLRLATLIGSLLLFGWFYFQIKNPLLTILLTAIAGLQFHLFQFFHFSMVEMLVNGCTLISLGFAYQYLKSGKGKSLLWSYLLVYTAFLLKIQYAYLLLLPFATWALGILTGNDIKYRKSLFGLVVLAISSVGLFYLAWYLPFRETFQTVWAHQGTNRFASWNSITTVFLDSGKYLVWNEYNTWFTSAFALSLPVGILYLFRSSHRLRHLLMVSGLWLIFESHKMIILYLPTRYSLSLFMAMALWMSIVICMALDNIPAVEKLKTISLNIAAGLLILTPALLGNTFNFKRLLNGRTFNSQSIIHNYENQDFNGQTIVGVWATSLIWNPTAHVIPVWKNFLNDDEILEKVKPPLIITEENEADSEQVFSSRGIDLKAISDSSAQYQYGKYKVEFYFMNY